MIMMMIMMDRRKAGGQICSVELLAQVRVRSWRGHIDHDIVQVCPILRENRLRAVSKGWGGGGQN